MQEHARTSPQNKNHIITSCNSYLKEIIAVGGPFLVLEAEYSMSKDLSLAHIPDNIERPPALIGPGVGKVYRCRCEKINFISVSLISFHF